MAAAVNENDKNIEGLRGERNGLAAAQQQALLGYQNEVAELKDPTFAHHTSLGNLQEKFKTFPKTSPVQAFTWFGWKLSRL